jgi:hypothetical protein
VEIPLLQGSLNPLQAVHRDIDDQAVEGEQAVDFQRV